MEAKKKKKQKQVHPVYLDSFIRGREHCGFCTELISEWKVLRCIPHHRASEKVPAGHHFFHARCYGELSKNWVSKWRQKVNEQHLAKA